MGVGDDDRILDLGEGEGEEAALLLGQTLGGEVFGDHQEQSLGTGCEGGVGSDPAETTIGVDITFFDSHGGCVAPANRFECAFYGGDIFGMDEVEAVALAELF